MRIRLHATLLIAICLLGLARIGAAQPTAAPLPADVFFKHPAVLKAKLSPSGNRLAITTSIGAPRVGLFVIELVGDVSKLRTALFKDIDVIDFEWVNDDRLVFKVEDLAAGSGEDQRAWNGLYGVNADGSQLRILVARRPIGLVVDPVPGRDALSYNHVLLHVPEPVEGAANEDVVVGTVVAGNDRRMKAMQPLWLNVRTGRTRSMDVNAPEGAISWLFNSRGEPRVAYTQREDKLAVHWRGRGQTDWQLLNEGDVVRPPVGPRFVDDLDNLYVEHGAGKEGFTVLSRYDFARRAPAAKPWVSVTGFDFRGEVISQRGGAAMGVRVETDAQTTVWLDDKMKQFQAAADARWPSQVNEVSCQRCGAANMVALVRSYSDQDPGQLWLYTATDTRWRLLARVQDGVDPRQMATVDFQRIKARDGRDLPVWLTLPPGHQAGKPSPAVVLVHGGPWVRGGHWRWQATEQFLASRGYVVISPEFRGSTGYGRAHMEAGFKQWGRAMQDDVADALLWAQGQGIADKRACIAGASYGGYATLMGLVRHPELYRCGIAWVAVTDPFLILEGSWWVRDDIGDSNRRFSLPQMVGDAKADVEMLTSVSPVAQADRIKAPVLLAFGESDLRVPLAHGKRLRDAMRKAGQEPEWVTYSNEAHSWRLTETQVDFAQRMEKFLAQHLLAK